MNSIQDLIHTLETDPDVRRQVFEAMGLPAYIGDAVITPLTERIDRLEAGTNARFDRLEADTNARFDRLETDTNARFDRVDARIDQIEKAVASLLKSTAALQESTAAINRRLDIVEREMSQMGQTLRDQIYAQAEFRGMYAEEVAGRDSLHIASLFASHNSLPSNMLETWPLGRNALKDIVLEHEKELSSLDLKGGERALLSFLRPDLIAGVKHLAAARDVEPRYYLVVEASYTIGERDLTRATDNALIIRLATGRPAYPVVAGVRVREGFDEEMRDLVYDNLAQFIRAGDPDAAYWHRLGSADLKPTVS